MAAAGTASSPLQPGKEEPIKEVVIELLLLLAAFAGAIVLFLLGALALSALLLVEQPERFLSDPHHRRGLLRHG